MDVPTQALWTAQYKTPHSHGVPAESTRMAGEHSVGQRPSSAALSKIIQSLLLYAVSFYRRLRVCSESHTHYYRLCVQPTSQFNDCFVIKGSAMCDGPHAAMTDGIWRWKGLTQLYVRVRCSRGRKGLPGPGGPPDSRSYRRGQP